MNKQGMMNKVKEKYAKRSKDEAGKEINENK